MKKYSLFIIAALALGLSACGDNKTKEKIVNGTIIDKNSGGSTSAAAAPTVAPTQTAANTQVAITDASTQVNSVLANVALNSAPTAPTSGPTGLGAPAMARSIVYRGGKREIQEGYSVTYSSDSTGWYSHDYTDGTYWNYSMKFRLTDNNGNIVSPMLSYDGYCEFYESASSIKRYEYKYSGWWDAAAYRTATKTTTTETNPLKRCDYTGNYTFVYNTSGSYADGVTTNGTYVTVMRYTDGATQTYTTILSNLSFAYSAAAGFHYTGGSFSMTYYDWSYYVAFNSDGSGSGYCRGPGYNYTITVSATTGEWTFTRA